MSDGPQPPNPPPAKPQLQIPPAAAPGQVPPVQVPSPAGSQVPPAGGQVPATQTPVVSLAPPPGGGKKPWIIMGILVALIGFGLWAVTGMQGEEESQNENEEEVAKEAPKKKAKPRKAEKTSERPMKKEMAQLSAKNRGEFEKNVGKWVRLQGEIRTGDEDGLIVFKDPAKMRARLVKGSAKHLSGKLVKMIGWMVSEELLQVDGVFEITVVDPIDLLPKKDVYTNEDGEQLVSLRNSKATFQGKVESFRISGDKKNYYLIFDGDSHEFYGSGDIKKLKGEKVTEEMLKELVGKTIKLKGKLGYKKQDKKDRVFINFDKQNQYEVLE